MSMFHLVRIDRATLGNSVHTECFFTLYKYILILLLIIIIVEMTVFNMADYLIEERRGWSVITASPRRQHSK